jgi:hypothetical protein
MDDDDKQIERYSEFKKNVQESGGFILANMGYLRDVHGAGKLGTIVVENISEQLKASGLGYFPDELPTLQSKNVFVYQIGTPASRLFEAVKNADENSVEIIKKFANTKDNKDTATIRKIRELVCD